MRSIESCRTEKLGGHVYVCDDCGCYKIAYNSCKNRNCPKCGNLKKEQWILDRKSELLPVQYFHTVFTVPHELNPLFLSNQELMYSLLFKAASQTLTELALNKKFLGAQIGITMVLHTWGQNLSYHPHVHRILPGGRLSPSGLTFVKSKKKFFLPVKILSKVFRAKLLQLAKEAFYANALKFAKCCFEWENEEYFLAELDNLYKNPWVVYCKKTFKEITNVIEYLSRYTHKTAIYNNRLVSVGDSRVTFKYRDYRDKNKKKLMTLDAMEFIRRFMQHVLPSGFQKIRYFGILSNRNRKTKLVICFKLTLANPPPKDKLCSRDLSLGYME